MPGAKKPAKRAPAPKSAKKAAAKPVAKPAKAKPAPKPAAKPKAPEKAKVAPPAAPTFVKEASAAARKAAMEALARELPTAAKPTPPPAPAAPAAAPVPDVDAPLFVREASPAARKAVVEALAQDAGVAPILARAPWRKPAASEAPSPAPAAPSAPAPPSAPLRMTKPADPAPVPRVGVSAKRPVILDTNALMMQFQFHIDIEREMRRLLDFGHEIVVPSIVIEELKVLAEEAKGKDAGEARMALELARSFKIMDSPGDGDTGILRLAEKLGNAIVVTNDKVLRARLRAKDIPNIYMRSSAFLTVEGHISGI